MPESDDVIANTIQQEVDRDEEVEQRRLQEEIERLRMERAKRRSALPGYGTCREFSFRTF
jgi:hypothetical protein